MRPVAIDYHPFCLPNLSFFLSLHDILQNFRILVKNTQSKKSGAKLQTFFGKLDISVVIHTNPDKFENGVFVPKTDK